MDVYSIGPGADYVDAITRALDACHVLLAVIGPKWLSAPDPQGRRLDDPDDWVRTEIRTALTRDLLVIPVLVQGARMPSPQELPKEIAGLARRHAVRLAHDTYEPDFKQLVTAVERELMPDILMEKLTLAIAYKLSGRRPLPTKVLQDLQTAAGHALGRDHRVTLEIGFELAEWYRANGEAWLAIVVLDHIRPIASEVLGRDDRLTLNIGFDLAVALKNGGRQAEANAMYFLTYTIALQALGANDSLIQRQSRRFELASKVAL